MSNKSHMVMVATKQPNKPVTVDNDVFTGTQDQCRQHSLNLLADVLANRDNPVHNSHTPDTTNLYWAPDNWVKLLVVPTVDIETK